MTVNATELRKDLFRILERVIGGETVEVVYRNSSVRLSPSSSGSKLSRAKRQKVLLCDPDSIVQTDPGVQAAIESELRKDWRKL
jgi:antitoxin (DNA-binding transcriptional repressor) of toxin-antitoxin stability system